MFELDNLSWEKMNFLLPAVVQDAFDGRVPMQGFMSREALETTLTTGKVTFWSRSREALWTKGETSGNTLNFVEAALDCDRDCLLVQAHPSGPTCHTGTPTCFDGKVDDGHGPRPDLAFLAELERVIRERDRHRPEGSYTTRLLEDGVKRIAQKVGEEGVETALAHAGVLLGDRLLHLAHQVGLAPHVVRVGNDACAGRGELVVGDGRPVPGPALDNHLVAVADELGDPRGSHGYAVLVRLDLGRHPYPHARRL
jgi:phosphoribosyl-ATP pyrophosphohydrolase/phosphoribosyl-AMP cyclohydrolase